MGLIACSYVICVSLLFWISVAVVVKNVVTKNARKITKANFLLHFDSMRTNNDTMKNCSSSEMYHVQGAHWKQDLQQFRYQSSQAKEVKLRHLSRVDVWPYPVFVRSKVIDKQQIFPNILACNVIVGWHV